MIPVRDQERLDELADDRGRIFSGTDDKEEGP
jgi:hypothetical protein